MIIETAQTVEMIMTNFVMTDMRGGDAWNEQATRAVHEVGDHGSIRDAAPGDGPAVENLDDCHHRLHLSFHKDWYVI